MLQNPITSLSLKAVNGVPVQFKELSELEKEQRITRFLANNLVLKNKRALIKEQLEEKLGIKWPWKTLDYWLKFKITKADMDDAYARLERGEIQATLQQRGKLVVAIVEPDAIIPIGTEAVYEARAKGPSEREELNNYRILHKNLSAAVRAVDEALRKTEQKPTPENVGELAATFRGVLRSIYPAVASSIVDIKNREARLGVLGALAFDDATDTKARVNAVIAAARILGDFQKPRQNEHDTNMRQLAERFVKEGIARTGKDREEVIEILARDCPEIVSWLQTPQLKASRAK